MASFAEQSKKARQYLRQLASIYCGDGIAFEFAHLTTAEEVRWFEKQVEANSSSSSSSSTELARSLLEAEAFDHFLAKKFQSVKRYGGEGAETMITFVEELVRCCALAELSELVIGMPHRGRLNLLVNTLKVPPEVLFRKMTGRNEYERRSESFIGDVLSHIYTSELLSAAGSDSDKPLQVTLLPNPSHLEVVDTVACGYARGRLMDRREGPYDHEAAKLGEKNEQSHQLNYCRLPLQIHGDASVSGQGICMETLALANVDHWSVGGSVHLVVNNQVGYTTPGRYGQARSSPHCTDLVKMINAPVIHVSGWRPDAVVRAARLAAAYRQHFQKDIAVNLLCFRRWGHNELDDPGFTNPRLYKAIAAYQQEHQSIPQEYAKSIGLPKAAIDDIVQSYSAQLTDALARVEQFTPAPVSTLYQNPNQAKNSNQSSPWVNVGWPEANRITKWRTGGLPSELLKRLARLSVSVPENGSGFNLHPTLKRVFGERIKKVEAERTPGMDWATAESLAFASLLWQGYDVRISGQDVGRGTFSQRHCMVVDQETEDVHIPLNGMNKANFDGISRVVLSEAEGVAAGPGSAVRAGYGKLEVCNSILSEEAVMAFEYGVSLASPKVLPIWEAQFGDFFNGAQPIIDTLVASGEAKWLLQSALTLLLPHGYDGAGPEHTSSRLERFLQLSNSSETEVDTDEVNWSVAYPSTPAQYYHLLRRQMVRPWRKPLVVMAPKALLRHPRCVSALTELTAADGHFAAVLDDPKHESSSEKGKSTTIIPEVKTLIFTSGKHYYSLEKERDERWAAGHLPSASSTAIVRLEELCPFPVESLVAILKRYPNAKNLIWSQEEHRNMGAWSFVAPRFSNILGRQLKYAGRGHLAAPAVGIGALHQAEVKQLLEDTFKNC